MLFERPAWLAEPPGVGAKGLDRRQRRGVNAPQGFPGLKSNKLAIAVQEWLDHWHQRLPHWAKFSHIDQWSLALITFCRRKGSSEDRQNAVCISSQPACL
jgi:hypothetical protein